MVKWRLISLPSHISTIEQSPVCSPHGAPLFFSPHGPQTNKNRPVYPSCLPCGPSALGLSPPIWPVLFPTGGCGPTSEDGYIPPPAEAPTPPSPYSFPPFPPGDQRPPVADCQVTGSQGLRSPGPPCQPPRSSDFHLLAGRLVRLSSGPLARCFPRMARTPVCECPQAPRLRGHPWYAGSGFCPRGPRPPQPQKKGPLIRARVLKATLKHRFLQPDTWVS